jgi:hypothetical protein
MNGSKMTAHALMGCVQTMTTTLRDAFPSLTTTEFDNVVKWFTAAHDCLEKNATLFARRVHLQASQNEGPE